MENSSIGRLASVFLAPGKTFKSIAERPTWLVALVVALIVTIAVTSLVFPRMDWEEMIRTQVEQSNTQLSEDQIQTQIGFVERFSFVFGIIGVVFSMAAYFIVALVLTLGTKLLGGTIDYKRALSTTVYGMMPLVLGALLAIPVILSQDTLSAEAVQSGSFLSSNLSIFAPEGASTAIRTLLASFDVFTLWSVILLVIGIGVVGRLKSGTAIGLVVGSWLFWVLIKTGWAALSSSFGG